MTEDIFEKLYGFDCERITGQRLKEEDISGFKSGAECKSMETRNNPQ
jgi:hypothetical protein